MAEQTNTSEWKCVVTRNMSEETRIRENALHDEAAFRRSAWLEGFIEGFKEATGISLIERMRSVGVSEEKIKRFLKLLYDESCNNLLK